MSTFFFKQASKVKKKTRIKLFNVVVLQTLVWQCQWLDCKHG